MNGYGEDLGSVRSSKPAAGRYRSSGCSYLVGNLGKNNKMFLLPMGFMIVVTICSLALTVKNQVGMIMAGGADWVRGHRRSLEFC